MADQNAAQSFFARARAKGSENNRDSINGEDVKKELQEAANCNYCPALKLWDQ